MRSLTNHERNIVATIANGLDAHERHLLLGDLAIATVSSSSEDGSQILFELQNYRRPPYRGQQLYAVECAMLDADNIEVSVLLFADENDRLLELEYVRWGSGDLIAPIWTTLFVTTPGRVGTACPPQL